LFYPHRYLPPFPTRRSSDLAGRRVVRGRPRSRRNPHPWPRGDARASHRGGGEGSRGCGTPARLSVEVRAVEVAEAVLVGREVRRDRKSTRLNSSHRTISYAV